ncbi:MAG: tetratricopeptide repeat protein, partial [Planctomycetota bacterium]
ALIFAAGAAYVITHHSTYAAGGVLGDDVTPLEYARTQPGVILHYLRLVFWPAGQCLDYGWPVATSFAEIVPPLLALLALLALTSWAAVHRPALGFLGGVFFILLAPSSSFAPLRDLAFEHRMYLPLAAVVTFIAAEVASLARSHRGEGASRNDHRRSLILTGIAAGVCVILGTGSHARNRVYANSFSAWEDVVEKAPANWRGHYNLGTEYMKAGDFARAEPLLRETIALRPTSYDAHFNLAIVLRGLGRFDESLASFTAAEEIRSDDPQLFANRGALLWDLGRSNDALRDYERALQLDAGNVLALTNYAQTLMEQDRPAEAVMLLRRAILSEPRRADVYVRLGLALAALGETCEAQVALEKAVEMNPRSPQAHYNLGRLLISSRPDLAARHFEATVRLDPGISDAHNNLGVLFESGDPRRAIRHYQDAVRADPSNLKARSNLQSLLRSSP